MAHNSQIDDGALPTADLFKPKPRREQFVRVPTTFLGMLLDGVRSGKGKYRTRDASAAAMLLCWKLFNLDRERYRLQNPRADFVLNERDCRKRLGIKHHTFHTGLRQLIDKGVLTRRKRGRAFAFEQLAAATGDHYVAVSTKLLIGPLPVGVDRTALVAFVLAVNLDPNPQRPETTAAKKLGIRSAMTVRKLYKAAEALGAIAVHKGFRGRFGWVAWGRILARSSM